MSVQLRYSGLLPLLPPSLLLLLLRLLPLLFALASSPHALLHPAHNRAHARRPASPSVCSLPGAPPATRLGPGDIEVGLGAHGEPGYEKRPWQPLDVLIPSMLARILSYGGGDPSDGGEGDEGAAAAHKELNSGKPLTLLVNNLGGTSLLEQFAVVNEALGWLAAQGVSEPLVGGGHGVLVCLHQDWSLPAPGACTCLPDECRAPNVAFRQGVMAWGDPSPC